MSDQNIADEIIPNGEEIVERFGGIRPMAAKLNVPVTTVQGWKKRDAIPAIRRDEIESAASLHDIDLRGLLTDPANENKNAKPRAQATSTTLPEDPALAAPASAAAAPAAKTRAHGAGVQGVDIAMVRRTARNTSMITTVSLLVIVFGAGYLLFAQGTTPSQGPGSPENRLQTIESRGAAGGTAEPGFVGKKLAEIEQQVGNIQTIMGYSTSDLASFAQSVAAGSGATLIQRLASLEQQLLSGSNAAPAVTGMVDRLQSMAQTPQGRVQMQQAIDELRTVVTGLQGRTDTLDTAISQAKADNQALASTLQDVTGRDLGAAAMLLALTQLRQSADREAPFTDDLALLRDVAQRTDPELAQSVEKLAPYAESGILTPAGLKRELLASANDIISAKMRGENVSITDKIMARIRGLFSVSKGGVPVAGASDEQMLIKQASAQLDKGDVAGAMATLNKLNGQAAQAAQPWKNKADATMVAQQIDGQLVRSLMQKIKTGFTGGGAGPINLAPKAAPQAEPQAEPQMSSPDGPSDPVMTIQQ